MKERDKEQAIQSFRAMVTLLQNKPKKKEIEQIRRALRKSIEVASPAVLEYVARGLLLLTEATQ